MDGIARRGGHLEQLHYLITRHGKMNLDSVIDHLLALPWRVPKSALMRISREESSGDGNEDDVVMSDEYFFWEVGLNEYGIPRVRFSSDPHQHEGSMHSAEELRSELHGKPLVSGMKVSWRGDDYYLTAIDFWSERIPIAGHVIDVTDIEFLHLVLAKYIDIEN